MKVQYIKSKQLISYGNYSYMFQNSIRILEIHESIRICVKRAM